MIVVYGNGTVCIDSSVADCVHRHTINDYAVRIHMLVYIHYCAGTAYIVIKRIVAYFFVQDVKRLSDICLYLTYILDCDSDLEGVILEMLLEKKD